MRQKNDLEYSELLSRLRVGASTGNDVKLLELRKVVIKSESKYDGRLNDIYNDDTRTAGLAKVIVVKIGAKIMIRRNVDVSLGLVNGAIGTIVSISKSSHACEDVNSITIKFNNKKEYMIQQVSAKFQIMNDAYVIRKQFLICLSYGITVHKSQGLSLKNAIIDVGNRVFCTGQTYVALSRVTSLEGVHLQLENIIV
ncbi:ATP-dependent DNA helicase PIF1-like [Chelonus insularis]|uniref:ATP-dependent DNA helicase PIF1-like n=1 Tax=Chelonus insularis TaxID=460826 RepID=UPI00158F5EEC|nr:ATP-dependent DNA helicase PIF1-like [Chelonus insularis]